MRRRTGVAFAQATSSCAAYLRVEQKLLLLWRGRQRLQRGDYGHTENLERPTLREMGRGKEVCCATREVTDILKTAKSVEAVYFADNDGYYISFNNGKHRFKDVPRFPMQNCVQLFNSKASIKQLLADEERQLFFIRYTK